MYIQFFWCPKCLHRLFLYTKCASVNVSLHGLIIKVSSQKNLQFVVLIKSKPVRYKFSYLWPVMKGRATSEIGEVIIFSLFF